MHRGKELTADPQSWWEQPTGAAVLSTTPGTSLVLVRLLALSLSFSLCTENLYKNGKVMGSLCAAKQGFKMHHSKSALK